MAWIRNYYHSYANFLIIYIEDGKTKNMYIEAPNIREATRLFKHEVRDEEKVAITQILDLRKK